jgi:hypothetical protein
MATRQYYLMKFVSSLPPHPQLEKHVSGHHLSLESKFYNNHNILKQHYLPLILRPAIVNSMPCISAFADRTWATPAGWSLLFTPPPLFFSPGSVSPAHRPFAIQHAALTSMHHIPQFLSKIIFFSLSLPT